MNRSQSSRLLFFGLCMHLLIALPASAKDLTSRLGIGMSNQFSVDLPSIAVRYYPQPTYGLSAALGIDTEEDNSRFGFNTKYYKIIFVEDNLNFYMGGQLGLVSVEDNVSGDTESGFELGGFAGAEFFFTGLDSLGFSFEAGVGVSTLTSDVRFRTVADSPLRAGITFYF